MSELVGGALVAFYFGRVLMALSVLALAGMAWRHVTWSSTWRFSPRDALAWVQLALIAAAFTIGAWMEFAE